MTTAVKPDRRGADRRYHPNQVKQVLRGFEVKAIDATERTFEGLAAAWSQDLGGDVIHPGAFAKSLTRWKERGFPIPLLNQHSYFGGIHDVLGSMIDAEEREEGLWAKFEVDEGPEGDKLLRHIAKKRLGGLSIGYEAVEAETDKDGLRHLREIKLMEVSAVIWPMNPDAMFDASSVKSLLTNSDNLKELSDDEIGELKMALDREAQAREQAANPPISQEKAAELRARLLSLRLRPLSSSARQKNAHLTLI
jgi:hypothetical protein